jgi:hypothetical protein
MIYRRILQVVDLAQDTLALGRRVQVLAQALSAQV